MQFTKYVRMKNITRSLRMKLGCEDNSNEEFLLSVYFAFDSLPALILKKKFFLGGFQKFILQLIDLNMLNTVVFR
jgi:hypothetical protein